MGSVRRFHEFGMQGCNLNSGPLILHHHPLASLGFSFFSLCLPSHHRSAFTGDFSQLCFINFQSNFIPFILVEHHDPNTSFQSTDLDNCWASSNASHQMYVLLIPSMLSLILCPLGVVVGDGAVGKVGLNAISVGLG